MTRKAAIFMALAAMAGVSQARADTLKTMDDVGTALANCWTPPAGTDGSSVTLSFSFKRDGNLIGPPRATAVNVKGDKAAAKAFADAAIASVTSCLPLNFAQPLAQGIAGSVYTMKFASPKQ